MWTDTSEVHDLCMQNIEYTQQLITDLRRKREGDARSRRLARVDDEPTSQPTAPSARWHHVPGLGHYSLARG